MEEHESSVFEGYVSVGRLAEETGVKPGTLRMWERRYGRPRPERLPSGHRRYSLREVRFIRRVVEAMALGHRPGEILRAGEDALRRTLEAERVPERNDEEVKRWLSLARMFDGDTLRTELREVIVELGLTSALDTRIGPFMTAIGSDWADGLLGVRHEHFVSEIIEVLLADLRMSARAAHGSSDPSVSGLLLATLPGETHGLGLSMTATVAQTAGWNTFMVGVDTPIEEIAKATSELEVRAVALSVSLANGGARTDAAIKELRAEVPEAVKVLVGGQGVRQRRRSRKGTLYLHDQNSLQRWLLDNTSGERRKSRPTG